MLPAQILTTTTDILPPGVKTSKGFFTFKLKYGSAQLLFKSKSLASVIAFTVYTLTETGLMTFGEVRDSYEAAGLKLHPRSVYSEMIEIVLVERKNSLRLTNRLTACIKYHRQHCYRLSATTDFPETTANL